MNVRFHSFIYFKHVNIKYFILCFETRSIYFENAKDMISYLP